VQAVGEMKNRDNLKSRLAKGAVSGFFIFPLIAAPHHATSIGKNSVKTSWSRVNGSLSSGVAKVNEKHERAKEAS